jgi:hypothetical protein
MAYGITAGAVAVALAGAARRDVDCLRHHAGFLPVRLVFLEKSTFRSSLVSRTEAALQSLSLARERKVYRASYGCSVLIIPE